MARVALRLQDTQDRLFWDSRAAVTSAVRPSWGLGLPRA